MLLGRFICLEGVCVQPNGVALVSLATFETYFSYQKAIWIATNDYYVYFYLTALSPLTVTCLLIIRSMNKFYSYKTYIRQVNAVFLLLF